MEKIVSIYNKNETNFIKNGISLPNAISCIVEEELNGKYLLELQYPVLRDAKYLYLQEENIIKADGQLFRIYNVVSDLDYIEVKARHIFYDLLHNFLEDVRPTDMNGTNALNHILNNTQYPHSFTGMSDIGNLSTQYYIRKNPVEAMLSEDSLVTRWNGELVRDNFNIKLLKSRGTNKGACISYGKNLLGLEVETNTDNLATRIIPMGYDGMMLPEKYIDSPLINNYAFPYIKKVDFGDIKIVEQVKEGEGQTEEVVTEAQAFDKLRMEVNNLYNINKVDIAETNIKANIVLLENTEEYKHLKSLVKVELGDIVSSTNNPLNVTFETKVIRVKRDVLTKRNVEVELGSFKKGMTDVIKTEIDRIEQSLGKEINTTKSDLGKAIERASDLLTNALGGHVIKRQGELLIMDTENPNTATKVWRWNLNG